jgi:hypothetical protein
MAITGFTAQLSVYQKKIVPALLNKAKQELAKKAVPMLVKATPVDTGRARGNWTVSLGTPSATHQQDTYDKSGERTIAQANIRIAQALPREPIHIENSVRYGTALELGHSQQAPHGMLRPVVRRLSGQ